SQADGCKTPCPRASPLSGPLPTPAMRSPNRRTDNGFATTTPRACLLLLRGGMAAPSRKPSPLIPILRAGDGMPDRDDLATWHEALAEAVGVEISHDLFALWLYPASGGVELIGPEALAQDDLPVP